MTPRLQSPAAPKGGLQIGRLLLATVLALLLGLATFTLLRAGVFYSLYTSLFAKVTETTGLDLWASRSLTLALLALLWLCPWHLLVLPWIKGAKRQVALWAAATVLALAAMEVVTRDVYFSRADGHPLKYYIQTLDGYQLAAAPGIDPVYGIPYKPITTEVARNYILWKRRGGQMQDPSLPEGQYFDPATGEALRWYARSPDGRLDVFTLPGFHPKYGTKLVPATAEIVAAYEKQKTEESRQRQEADRKRKEQERQDAQRRATAEAAKKAKEEQDRKAREKAEAIQRAREERIRKAREEELTKQPLQPGRYLFADPRPCGTLDGLKFTLTEVDLAADKMLVHVEVENVGVDSAGERPWSSGRQYIRLSILTSEGTCVSYTSIRAKEGSLPEADGTFTFPGKGKRGAFVLEFPSLPDTPGLTFSVTVNDQPLLSPLNLRKAHFQTF